MALWEERKDQFEQCLELQLFMRDTDQADNWMAKQEVIIRLSLIAFKLNAFFVQSFLANEDIGDSLEGVEVLITKHENFEKTLAAQEEKFKASLHKFTGKAIAMIQMFVYCLQAGIG